MFNPDSSTREKVELSSKLVPEFFLILSLYRI